MPTLVTGATGFLGTHLVRELRAGGATVRVLVRSIEAAAPLREYGVGIFPGDILDTDAIRLAAHGCERVFHLAGIVSHEQRGRARMEEVNIGGTRALLASVERGARVVHVSSVATLGPVSSPDRRADETHVLDPAATLVYASTKRAAELVALEAAAGGADVVVANPGFLIGPGDVRRVSTWPIDAYLSGKLRFTTAAGSTSPTRATPRWASSRSPSAAGPASGRSSRTAAATSAGTTSSRSSAHVAGAAAA